MCFNRILFFYDFLNFGICKICLDCIYWRYFLNEWIGKVKKKIKLKGFIIRLNDWFFLNYNFLFLYLMIWIFEVGFDWWFIDCLF